jgi:hypothetical protein
MTRTNVPMFTSPTEAANWSQPLPADRIILAGEAGYWAAHAEVADAVEAEYCADVDADDTDAMDEARKVVSERVNNTWAEGISHDEWVSAALRSLRRA